MTIPLQNAFLCVNCDMIGDSAAQCQACSGTSLISLSGVMNRKTIYPLVTYTRPEFGDPNYKGK